MGVFGKKNVWEGKSGVWGHRAPAEAVICKGVFLTQPMHLDRGSFVVNGSCYEERSITLAIQFEMFC